MAEVQSRPFLTGVIEGFYGRPWTTDQRRRLFAQMQAAGLRCYAYGPKDDLHHRACWREAYSESACADLRALIDLCHAHDLRFLYALGPGLDVCYADPEDSVRMAERYAQIMALGADDVALLFDDIPDTMAQADAERFGSFAKAHAHVANEVFARLTKASPDLRFLFCPTPYCSRMADAALGGEGYLRELGEALHPEIDVFWTGPEIISATIDDAHARMIGDLLKRPPMIWDNLQANDYDLRRLFVGPCQGRPSHPEESLSGIFINPNCEFEANFIPIHTLGAYVSKGSAYQSLDAFSEALESWLPAFASTGDAWTLDEVRLLAEIFYLPHEDGAAAQQLLEDAMVVASRPPDAWGEAEGRLREWHTTVVRIAVKLTELKNRDLFYTFNRQWWELREELELLSQYMDWRQSETPDERFFPSEHLLGTFRGGVVARLQGFLAMEPDGSIKSTHA